MKKLIVGLVILLGVAVIGLADVSPVYAANHCGTLLSPETWTTGGNVHVLTCDVIVSSGVTLTIAEGAIVKFSAGTSLIVQGNLQVAGTAGNKVYFTSLKDDTVGGDTNGDAGATAPAIGDWLRIEFQSSSSSSAIIDHAVIRYGGGSVCCWTNYGAVMIYGAAPTIQNSTLTNNGNYALYADLSAAPKLAGNNLTNNAINGLTLAGGTLNIDATWSITDTAYYLPGQISLGTGRTLTVTAGVVVKLGLGNALLVNGSGSLLRMLGTAGDPVFLTSIRDDTLKGDTNNDNAATLPAAGDWLRVEFGVNSSPASLIDHAVIRYGGGSVCCWTNYGALTFVGASPTIQNSTLSTNANYAYLADLASFPTLTNNALNGNGINGLTLSGGTLTVDAVWNMTDTAYYLLNSVSVGTGRVLTITAGVVVKFSLANALLVNGAGSRLLVQGALGNPVYFTSIRDDTLKGDTNNDGGATAPAAGDWLRLEFAADSSPQSLMDYAVIRYGGGSVCCWTNYGALTFVGARPTIQNTALANNANYAYLADLAASPTLRRNTLTNNGINGLTMSGGTLTADATWGITDTVYYLRDGVSIGAGKTLTVTAGVVVKFSLTNTLLVNGASSALRVLGAPGNPVSFTSIRDDTLGGDTNNDGGATTPLAGDWLRIEFGTNSSPTSVMDRADIRYGGGSVCCWTNYGALTFLGASPTIQRSTIANSGNYAYLADLTAFPQLSGNVLTNNVINGLAISGGTLNQDATWGITDTVYYVRDAVSIGAGKTLTLTAGTVLKFSAGNSLLVNGVNSALRVLGTAGNPVFLTSLRDDATKGDTNNDGGATAPAAGDWLRVEFAAVSSSARALIDHAVIRYGGGSVCCWTNYGAIHLTGASPTIQNTIFSHNAYGLLVNNATPGLTCNDFYSNSPNAVSNIAPATLLNARNQWWGSTSGPHHSAANPGGTGDDVTDGIDFTPWRTLPCNLGAANLSLGQSDQPDPAGVGQWVTYTVTLTNQGPDPATNVVLTDTLPFGATFHQAVPSQGSCEAAVGGKVVCNLGTIASNGSATLLIAVAPTAPGVVTNTVIASANEFDPALPNTTAQTTTILTVVQRKMFLPLILR